MGNSRPVPPDGDISRHRCQVGQRCLRQLRLSPSFNLVQRYEPNVRRSILSDSLGAEEQSPASQVTKSSDGRCGSKHNCPPPGVQKVTVELPRARHPSAVGAHTMHLKLHGEPVRISAQHGPYFCFDCLVLLLEAVLRSVGKGRWSRVSPAERVGVGTGESQM